jgi:hypothetical protein
VEAGHRFASARQYWLIGLAIGVYGLGAAAARHVAPLLQLPSICMFRLATGVPCPGCGSTRAGLALLQGHLGEALRQNPLTASLMVLAALYAVAWLVARGFGRRWRPRLGIPGRGWGLALVLVVIALNWAYLITASPSRVGTRPAVWARLHPPG